MIDFRKYINETYTYNTQNNFTASACKLVFNLIINLEYSR